MPAALWLVRDRPRDDQPEAEAPSEPEASLPLRDILRTRTFWVLVFTHVSYWLFLLMVLSSFVLMLVDRGMSRADATAHLAAATLIGGFAKVGFGLLALRMSARSAMRLDYGLLTLAAGLLFFIDHAWAVSAFVL